MNRVIDRPSAFDVCEKLVLLALIVVCFIAAQAQTPRGMAPADILRVANVTDAQISPNGEWIAYAVSVIDGERSVSTIWLVRLNPRRLSDSRESRYPAVPLVPAGWNASTPRWSPDSSTIAFFGSREGLSGIWTISPQRREQPRFIAPVQTTNFFVSYAGEGLTWSPDSKRIAYISATEETESSTDPRVIDRIQYKSRQSFSDNRRTHVWIVSLERPEPRQLTSGLFYDHAVAFSPRGDEIAFLSNHEPDPDSLNNSDIFAVDVGGQVRQITQTKGCEYDPSWSPDGKWIAYTATKREVTTIDSVSEDTHIWITTASGDARRELTDEQDRRARNPRWSPDSRSVLYLAGDQGLTTIFDISLSGGMPRQLVPDTVVGEQLLFAADDAADKRSPRNHYQISNFSVARVRNVRSATAPSGSGPSPWSVAFSLSTSVSPTEVWWDPGAGYVAHRLTSHNAGIAPAYDLREPTELTFKSFDGVEIQGWLLRPAGFRSDRKYPLILSIHGGPHGMFSWSFNATFQVYAARGYAVLYLNPRGSSGYGQKFSDGTRNEWGGGDYKDLMAGVDEALRRYSWIDPDRLGVTGGSYGGFMTNWIITQTTRFKAAVAAASVSNLISFYSTSLYQDLVHAEFGGFPWDNYELLWQWSPLRYVSQAQTPTLFLHGEQDNDVHITQAEEMYMALRRRGVDTVFVRYPREGHGLREPAHRVDSLERTIAWFDRFLK